MSGNATEEYLLTKLDYPGHLDAGRLAGLAGAATGIVAGLVAKGLLGPVAGLLAGLGIGFGLGIVVFRWLSARDMSRKVEALHAARAEAEADTEARIAAMKARH